MTSTTNYRSHNTEKWRVSRLCLHFFLYEPVVHCLLACIERKWPPTRRLPGDRVWRCVHHGRARGGLAPVRLPRGLLLNWVSQRQGGSLRQAQAPLRSQQPGDAGRVARPQKGKNASVATNDRCRCCCCYASPTQLSGHPRLCRRRFSTGFPSLPPPVRPSLPRCSLSLSLSRYLFCPVPLSPKFLFLAPTPLSPLVARLHPRHPGRWVSSRPLLGMTGKLIRKLIPSLFFYGVRFMICSRAKVCHIRRTSTPAETGK